MPIGKHRLLLTPYDAFLQAKAPELGTAARAEQRAEFDEHTQARLAEAEAKQEQIAKDKAIEKQKEIKRLRQTMEFKAQPFQRAPGAGEEKYKTIDSFTESVFWQSLENETSMIIRTSLIV